MTIQKYEELPQDTKDSVFQFQIAQVLKDIAEGYLSFQSGTLNEKVQAAWEEMEKLRTPWFIGERLLEDAELKEAITAIAQHQCEGSLYSRAEVVVPLEMVDAFIEQNKKPEAANSNN